MKTIRYMLRTSAFTLAALLLPSSLLAGPVTVTIDDTAKGPPVVQVLDSDEHLVYVGPIVNDPAVEDGALIVLFGVDREGSIPNMGWRFIDTKAPDPLFAAKDIVWIDHDDIFGGNDLRVGFNSRKPGTGWYRTPPPNPEPGVDVNAGPVKTTWITLYSDNTVVVKFRGPAPKTQ